ncbi:poly(A)-specific ribonuclease PNLDC1 isoform X2 [Ornithorhynchus anatinus]|uniref:poly(A)-specific ribonuclease PNLDC1 isoform X2 n=1 Tax=Ornithorhynchus anatinus TaxID=9258 RepID=UPI0010A770F2|nr:poly(A)-specific ribonuclease PNLDC1 isoform X2 [Ornithorhynchus anatinus]
MDVLAEQFEQRLPLLRRLLRRARFLSLDVEFTGLRSSSSPGRRPSLFDSPAEWYAKTRPDIRLFTACQIGLSVFAGGEGNSNKYEAHSYNFFLFPTTFGILDSQISFQASSIEFLNRYGFDYNKFLKNGVPYLNEEQEERIQQALLSGNWKVRRTVDRDQLKAVIGEVTRWLALAQDGDRMTLRGVTGFQVFNIQLVLRQALPDVWTFPKDREIVVQKVSREHRWCLENSPQDPCRKESILLSARGFSVLFRMLAEARKPLVGHNMLMDLLFLHEKFYRPLPESYEQFKQNVHGLFPVLVDTKNVTNAIWKELNFPRASNLFDAYEILSSDLNPTNGSGPEITHASECLKYVDSKYPHEAAYDAFLCGSVCLKVAHLLLHREAGSEARPEPSFPTYLEVLTPYLNQVNLIRGGVSKINFPGPDGPGNRPPVLIVKVRRWPGVDEEQIYHEFKDCCVFDVRRLGRDQFLLMTNKFKNVGIVLRDYRSHPDLQVALYRYWRHSPLVNCTLQICGIVTAWALVAFILGRSPRAC